MATVRSVFHRVLAALAVLAAAVLVIAAGFFLWLNTDSGRLHLEAWARTAAQQAGLDVQLIGLGGRLPVALSADEIRIADGDGPFLTLTEVSFRWSPFALVVGRIRVDELSAGSVSLERLPVTAPGKDAAERASGGLEYRRILDTRIKRLAIRQLTVGEAVFGEPATWRVAAEIGVAEDADRASRIEIARIDEREDSLVLEARYRPAESTLSLSAGWDESPGGAIARLLRLGAEDAIQVRLQGDGSLEDWRGRLYAEFGSATTDLMLRIEGHDEPRLSLSGDMDASRLVPARFESIAAGRLEATVNLRERERYRVIRVPAFEYRTEVLSFSASGSLDRSDGAVSAALNFAQTADAGLGTLLAPVETVGLSGHLEILGSLDEPRVEASYRADRLVVTGVTADAVETSILLSPAAAGGMKAMNFEARVGAGELGWSLAGTQELIHGPATAALRGRFTTPGQIQVDDVVVQLPEARVSGTIDLDLQERKLQAPLKIRVEDLDAIDPLARIDLEGTADLDVDLRLPAFDGRVAIAVAGRTNDFEIDLPVVRAVTSGQMDIAAVLDISPNTGLEISDIRIVGDGTDVVGAVAFPPDYATMTIDAEARLRDSAVLSEELHLQLHGPASVAAQLTGPTGDPSLDGTIEVAQLDLPAGHWERLSATVSLARLATGANGPVSIIGEGPIGETRVETRLVVGDKALDLEGLEADAGTLRVNGHLSVPYAGAPMSGLFEARSEDIGPLVAGLIGREGAGRMESRLELDDESGVQGVTITAIGDDVRVTAGPDRPLSFQRLEMSARLAGLGEGSSISAEMRLKNAAGPSVRFTDLEAKASGALSAIRLDGDAKGRLLGAPIDVSLTTAVHTDGTRRTVTLERLSGSLDRLPLESEGTATLLIADDLIKLEDVSIQLGEGSVAGMVRLGTVDAAIDMSVASLPMSLLKLLYPAMLVSGRLDAEIDVRAADGGTAGTVDLRLQEVMLPHRRRSAPLAASLRAGLAAGGLDFEATMSTAAAAPIHVTGRLPLQLDLVRIEAGMKPQGELRGRLEWSGDAFDLLSLFPVEDHLVNGATTVVLDLSGTVADPQIVGSVNLHQGRYEHLIWGTTLVPLDLTIEGDGQSLRLVRLEAGDGGAGTLSGNGELSLDPQSGFPLQAALTFQGLTLLRRDEVTGRASGELAAGGPLENLRVSGKLTTEDVEVQLVNNLPPEVVELEIVEIDALQSDISEENGTSRRRKRLIDGTLDIGIHMPKRVFVRGLGLDSEWGGDLSVTGNFSQPQIIGRLESIRGVMMFLGRRFRIESSSIAFTGGREIQPELDIRAVHEGTELTVTVNLTGPISNPDLALSSVPPVPEDEILARALFNKSTGQLSAVEAVQLAAAVQELTTRSSGPGVLARLREAVGVDVLRFGTTETAEGEQATTVEAGRYLVERLYVGVETSTVEEGSSVTVEYEVTRRIRATTDLKQTGGTNIGIEYRRDY